jgi:uncharacterized protein (DUF2062 family)
MNGHTVPGTLLVILAHGSGRVLSGVPAGAIGEGMPALLVDTGATDDPGPFSNLPIERLRLAAGAEKGAAVLAAAALAKERGYGAIVTIDADGGHDPADLRLLLDAAASWPAIVIGARNSGAGSRGIDLSGFLVRLECGESLPDTGSGFRLYPVEFLTSRCFTARGRGFEVETLVRGAWAGLPLLTIDLPRKSVPAPGTGRDGRDFRGALDLALLHVRLVARSLLPWPHRRMVPKAQGAHPLQFFSEPLHFFRLLCREHASPAELAAAVWVGIFVGALPIIPFGIAAIVYVNHKLHLNKLAGVAASNVCVFPFVPFLCVEVGHFFRFGRFWSEFNRQTLLHEIHHRLWEWLLGALVVGPLVGFAGALITYLLVRYLRSPLRNT